MKIILQHKITLGRFGLTYAYTHDVPYYSDKTVYEYGADFQGDFSWRVQKWGFAVTLNWAAKR